MEQGVRQGPHLGAAHPLVQADGAGPGEGAACGQEGVSGAAGPRQLLRKEPPPAHPESVRLQAEERDAGQNGTKDKGSRFGWKEGSWVNKLRGLGIQSKCVC